MNELTGTEFLVANASKKQNCPLGLPTVIKAKSTKDGKKASQILIFFVTQFKEGNKLFNWTLYEPFMQGILSLYESDIGFKMGMKLLFSFYF